MKREGYPTSARLRRRPEYRRVLDGGRRVLSRSLIVYVAPRPEPADGPRLGVMASRKVGNAVVRNRAKRVFREAFRRLRARVRRPVDLVLIATRRTVGVSTDDVVLQLQNVLREHGLLE